MIASVNAILFAPATLDIIATYAAKMLQTQREMLSHVYLMM